MVCELRNEEVAIGRLNSTYKIDTISFETFANVEVGLLDFIFNK